MKVTADQVKELVRRKGVIGIEEIAATLCFERAEIMYIPDINTLTQEVLGNETEFVAVTSPYGELGIGLRSRFMNNNNEPKQLSFLDKVKKFLGFNN